jgi:hypothetical protein
MIRIHLVQGFSCVCFLFGHFHFHLSPDSAMHLIIKTQDTNNTNSTWQDFHPQAKNHV